MFVRELKNNISLNYPRFPLLSGSLVALKSFGFFVFHYSDRTKQLKRALVSTMFPALSSIL